MHLLNYMSLAQTSNECLADVIHACIGTLIRSSTADIQEQFFNIAFNLNLEIRL